MIPQNHRNGDYPGKLLMMSRKLGWTSDGREPSRPWLLSSLLFPRAIFPMVWMFPLYTSWMTTWPLVMSTQLMGLCEISMGPVATVFELRLWQQAAAEGITAFVSSGDNGGLVAMLRAAASTLRAVWRSAESHPLPYSVAVGGTQFDDVANPGAYWSDTTYSTTASPFSVTFPRLCENESSNIPTSSHCGPAAAASAVRTRSPTGRQRPAFQTTASATCRISRSLLRCTTDTWSASTAVVPSATFSTPPAELLCRLLQLLESWRL